MHRVGIGLLKQPRLMKGQPAMWLITRQICLVKLQSWCAWQWHWQLRGAGPQDHSQAEVHALRNANLTVESLLLLL